MACDPVQILFPACDTIDPVGTIAALRALSVAGVGEGDNVTVNGGLTSGDGKGGIYVWVPSSTADDNGSTVIRPSSVLPLQAGRWLKIDVTDLTFTASGFGAVASTIDDKLRQPAPTARDFGAAINGTTDTRGALLLAAATGSVVLTPGLYYVASSVTIPVPVIVEPGARLVVPSGVTITFTDSIEAGEYQIFNLSGTGAVAGLMRAKQAWFDGDVATLPGLPTGGACDTFLQAAFNAMAPGGILEGDARVRVKGAALIDTKRASYHGSYVSFLWNSSVTNGFNVTAGQPGFIREFRFAPLTPGTIPTAGVAVLVGRTDCDVTDFEVIDAYEGMDIAAGVTQFPTRYRIYGALRYGLRVRTIDVYPGGGLIQALADWVTLSGVTGTFNLYDSISVAGSVGYIAAVYDGNRFRIFFNDAQPTAGMAITSGSGGSATIASATIGHQLGGLRTEGNVEAVTFRDMDVLGGLYSRVIVSSSGTPGRSGNMYACHFAASVYFDTSYLGGIVDGMAGSIDDSWNANSRVRSAPGVIYRNTSRLRGTPHFVANSGFGAIFEASCIHTALTTPDFDGNCRKYNAEGDMAELRLVGAIQHFTLHGFIGGFPSSSTRATPPLAIALDTAASDYIKFIAPDCPAGSVVWNSTGTNNVRVRVPGLGDL